MEGLAAQQVFHLFDAGWQNLNKGPANNLDALITYTDQERRNASNGQMKTTLRVLFFWTAFGLDINNWDSGAADNRPYLGSPIATTVQNHDDAWDAALTAVSDAGVTGPSKTDVIDSFEVRHRPGNSALWQFRITPEFPTIMLAAQFSEYLRRLAELPQGAREYASLGYAAYNASPQAAADLFNAADALITADPATWQGRTHEDALMTYRMTNDEIAKTHRGSGTDRSIAPRVQLLHVAACTTAGRTLCHGFGRHQNQV